MRSPRCAERMAAYTPPSIDISCSLIHFYKDASMLYARDVGAHARFLRIAQRATRLDVKLPPVPRTHDNLAGSLHAYIVSRHAGGHVSGQVTIR